MRLPRDERLGYSIDKGGMNGASLEEGEYSAAGKGRGYPEGGYSCRTDEGIVFRTNVEYYRKR